MKGGSHALPLPVAIFLVLTVLVPVEFGFNIGSLFFTWSKAYLLVMTIAVVPLAFMQLKLKTFDWLVIGHVGWAFVAFLVGFGVRRGIETAGTYFIEILTVYLMLRLYVRTPEQMLKIVKLLFVLVAVAGLMAIPEAIQGERFIHDFARSVTGRSYPFSNEGRLGMLRAASFFEHPILYGVFCAAIFSFVWFLSGGIMRIVRASVVAIATFFSLSSAPLLVLVAQLGLIGVDLVTRWLPGRVTILTLGFIVLIVLLEFGTGRGALGWLTMVMLNPATAWYRKAQIEYSMDDVLANPLFGIGDGDWTRPFWLSPSIDNHFIYIAMRSGMPALIMLLAAMFSIWRSLSRVRPPEEGKELFGALRKGWGLMMIALLLAGATVTFFGRMQPLFAFYIGVGASLAAMHAGGRRPASRRRRGDEPFRRT